MAEKKVLAVKLDSKVAERVRRYCAERGLKQSFFVENALLDQMERNELNEDLLDFKKQRAAEKDAISFEDYLQLRHV